MPHTLFIKKDHILHVQENADHVDDKSHLLWCDLHCPVKSEEIWVESLLGVEIPTRDEMHEIEPSSRYYLDKETVYSTVSFVTKTDTPEPEIHAVSFVITAKTLVTIRYSDPYSFRQFSKKIIVESGNYHHGFAVAVGLIESAVNRLADIIEASGHSLDELNGNLFRPALIDKKLRQHSMPDFEDMLRQIGVQADMLSKARESLLSISRMLSFLKTSYSELKKDDARNIDVILADVPALLHQADSLSNKTAFLLDAALGLVGIQQTSIIKIFSVAAVVFLPPTLVASIYGMNFEFMPELGWKAGYPMAITLMLLSAWLPYSFFKKKKWL